MSNKKPKDFDESIRIHSIDDEVALRILCRLAGSVKNFADISGIPGYKINNIFQGKATIRQEMLLTFYRDTLKEQPDFTRILQDTALLMQALSELGIISPGPGLTEMDEFEAKCFDLTHGESEVRTPETNFEFRAKKPLDKPVSKPYNSPTIEDIFNNNVGDSTPTSSPTTGDILANVKLGGVTHANVVTDGFEVGLRNIPDKFDSDNKRW